MITTASQRWRGRRSSYRPVGDILRFDPSRYEVAAIDGKGADVTARTFVETHHYSGTMGASRERIGLYTAGGQATPARVAPLPEVHHQSVTSRSTRYSPCSTR